MVDETETKIEAEEEILKENLEETTKSTSDSENETEAEILVSIEGETPPQEEDKETAKWVKDLRKTNRELQKKVREHDKEKEAREKTEQNPSSLRAKPTLDDFDFDTENYENDLDKWYEEKRENDDRQIIVANEKKQETEKWNSQLDVYSEKKKALKVKDYEEAESAVMNSLSATQQGIIIQGMENPALLFYAMYKSDKLKSLSEITDPVKFTVAAAKLETKLKVTNRKATTSPEQTISGKSGVSASSDTQLEKLRKEAEQTGNYTKVSAYKKKLKDKQK